MDLSTFQQKVSESSKRGEILFIGTGEEKEGWISPPESGTVLALGPHQDDPDAIAVTLSLFAQAGCRIRYLIVCSSHGGVTDSYALKYAEENNDLPVKNFTEYKTQIRIREQLESAELAGFVKDPVEFLSVKEGGDGNLIETPENELQIEQALFSHQPDIVVLPHGNDINSGHKLVCRYFRQCAERLAGIKSKPILALYCRDPKTISITEQLVVPFDDERASWKAELLKTHRSQHERNFEQRGFGFDERLLRLNRQIIQEMKERCSISIEEESCYAESFQVELFN